MGLWKLAFNIKGGHGQSWNYKTPTVLSRAAVRTAILGLSSFSAAYTFIANHIYMYFPTANQQTNTNESRKKYDRVKTTETTVL